MKLLSLSLLLALSIGFSCSPRQQVGDAAAINAIENGLITGVQVMGQPATTFSIRERMAHYRVPGLSIAVIKGGELSWAKGYGIANAQIGSKVHVNTLFQAGSISKPLAALAALKMAQEGKVELGKDVNSYLKDWKIPETKFTSTEKVTLRRLLTHTAGMTVHGFPGYHATMRMPSIQNVLSGRGNTPAILVDTIPGSIWRYSGGGYTVMEKVVEDVSGLPLDIYMEKNVLGPMNMSHSTYAQPLPDDRSQEASAAYDSEGNLVDGLWHNYPEQAAAGLWTTPSDLAKYCLEIQQIVAGKEDGILSQEMVNAMLTKDKNGWGMGPSIKGDGDSLRFEHGGKNEGFTNNMIAFVNKGEGIIIMTNGDNGGRLIGEIINAASEYYGWGMSNVVRINVVKLAEQELQKFTGKYRFSEQVPGLGDYLIEIKLQNGQLLVIDPEENQSFNLVPTEAMKFIDVTKGDQISFTQDEEKGLSLLWNNAYQFSKVE